MDIVGGSDDLLPVAVCGGPGVYRAGLMTVLRSTQGVNVVVEFDTMSYNPVLLRAHQPRVLLMDVDSFELGDLLSRQLVSRTAEESVRVLALSANLDPGTALRVLLGGAHGFLHKDTPVQGLVDAIRAVDRGGVSLDPQVASELVTALRFSGPSGVPDGPGDAVKLTPRQQQILGLLGHGLTNVEIAKRLQLGRPTVKTHISSLLRALELRDRTQLAVYACTHGFRSHVAVTGG